LYFFFVNIVIHTTIYNIPQIREFCAKSQKNKGFLCFYEKIKFSQNFENRYIAVNFSTHTRISAKIRETELPSKFTCLGVYYLFNKKNFEYAKIKNIKSAVFVWTGEYPNLNQQAVTTASNMQHTTLLSLPKP